MHIAMSRGEIASFLEMSQVQVEHFWRKKRLKRTIYNGTRLSPALANSSVFDVLEFALSNGDMPVKLSREEAALWVTYLCEVSEWDNWQKWDIFERASQLLVYAVEDGLVLRTDERAGRIAMTVAATQATLTDICVTNDRREALSEAV